MIFNWILCDKFPQIVKALLNALADLNSAVVCLILIIPLTSTSPIIYSKLEGTFPRTLTTIDITSSSLSQLFLLSDKSRYLSSFLLSFVFTL